MLNDVPRQRRLDVHVTRTRRQRCSTRWRCAMQAPERLPIGATCQLRDCGDRPRCLHRQRRRNGRYVSSIRQVVGADGAQVVTNEIFRPDADGRAVPGIAPPHDFADDLVARLGSTTLRPR